MTRTMLRKDSVGFQRGQRMRVFSQLGVVIALAGGFIVREQKKREAETRKE